MKVDGDEDAMGDQLSTQVYMSLIKSANFWFVCVSVIDCFVCIDKIKGVIGCSKGIQNSSASQMKMEEDEK